MDKLTEELHKRIKKVKNFRRIYSYERNNIWSADLIEFIPFSRENDGFKYVLCVVDCYTRFAFCVPLKNKNANTVYNAFKYIIDETGYKPNFLWTDEGKEFYNDKLDRYLKENQIKLYSTYGENKSVIVERFNQNIKGKIYKMFTRNGNHQWIDILNNLVDQYNNTKHSGVKFNTPRDMMYDNIRLAIKQDNRPIIPSKLKIGDRVRINYKRGILDNKGYLPNWTYQIYTICEVLNTNPITYKIKDERGDIIKGSFYEEEVQKTNQKENIYLVEDVLKTRIKNKKKEYLIKWLGYNDSYNSWEPEENVEHDLKKIGRL